jgi:hypothetical protein
VRLWEPRFGRAFFHHRLNMAFALVVVEIFSNNQAQIYSFLVETVYKLSKQFVLSQLRQTDALFKNLFNSSASLPQWHFRRANRLVHLANNDEW